MLEKEIKILSTRVEELLPRLIDLHAVDLGEEMQTNTVMAFVSHPFPPGDYFRIRSFASSKRPIEITYKSLKNDRSMRVSEETTLFANSLETAIALFQKLGMVVIYQGTKRRHSFSFMGTRLDFDHWIEAGFPDPYLEIEAESDEILHAVLEVLELSQRTITLKSIAELINEVK